MAPSKDLPGNIVEHITALARGRCIPGTNRYARVCRQWRKEGANSDLPQVLQLCLDQRWLDDADIARLSDYLYMHGHHVRTLVVEACHALAKPLDWFLGPAAVAALYNLSWLEVAQLDSLALLAPVLDKLPQLQHLAAHVGLTQSGPGFGGTFEDVWQFSTSEADNGSFCLANGSKYWEIVPSLQQLCPQLKHLQLTMLPQSLNIYVDPRLGLLMPEGLQQLTLINMEGVRGELAYRVWLPYGIADHSALQQLVLHDVLVPYAEAWELVKRGDMSALCNGGQDDEDQSGNLEPAVSESAPLQVHMHMTYIAQEAQRAISKLAPVLTDYQVPTMADVLLLSGPNALTRLVLATGLGGAAVNTLAALTGLVELDLGECGSRLAAAVEQAAGMPALRSLSVKDPTFDLANLNSSLARCTQLTALQLLLCDAPAASVGESESADEYEGESDESGAAQGVETAPVVSALQQLTGLRCLTVPVELLEWEAGAWLVPLTALSRLCVHLPDLEADHPEFRLRRAPSNEWLGQRNVAEAQAILQQVQVWPASLQCVVFWVAPPTPIWRADVTFVCPKHWEHTPAGWAGAPLQVWLELPGGVAQGWPRPFLPCPHLQGVWELQAAAQGS